MKIKTLRLQNIKSYEDQTVTFYDGVNFISGINGAGKSTIIEAIGFVLFDYKPGTVSDFIRYGYKSGIVTLEFEAMDGHLYKVVRKLGTTNSWLVFDAETETEIDLHGAADIKPWLKEVIGIDKDQDMAQLFNDIVGVSQGTFTSPFLETPANRKHKFNKILKVEAYNEVFNKTREVVGVLKDKLAKEEANLARLEGRIEDFDQIKQEQEEVQQFITKLKISQQYRQRELEQKVNERNNLRALRAKVEQTDRSYALAKHETQAVEDTVKQLTSELVKAEFAAKQVSQARPGYEKYLGSQKLLNELEEQRYLRDKFNIALNEVVKKSETLEATITSEKKHYQQQYGENTEYLKEKTLELTSKEQFYERVHGQASKLDALKQENSSLEEYLVIIEREVRDLQTIKVRINDGSDKFVDLISEIKSITNNLAQEARLKQQVSHIQLLEEELAQKRLLLAGEEQKANTLKDNSHKSADGQCPFLSSPCQNVGGDLKKYFTEQIHLTEKYIIELQQLIAGLESKITEGKASKDALDTLNAERKNLIRLQADEKKFILAFEKYFAEAKDFLTLKSIQGFAKKTEELLKHPLLTDFKSKDCLEDYKRRVILIIEQAKTYETNLQKLNQAFTSDILYTCISSLKDNLDGKIKIDEIANQIYKQFKQFIDAEDMKRSADLSSIKAEITSLKRSIQGYKEKLVQLQLQTQAISKKEQDLQAYLKEKQELTEKLTLYKNLDTDIKNTKAIQDENIQAYQVMLQYQEQAAREQELTSRINEEKSKQIAKILLMEQLEKELQILKESFNEQQLAEIEAKVEVMQSEVAQERQLLQEKLTNNEALVAKINMMEAIKQEILKVQEMITKYNAVKETVEFMRGIYNKAGERVATVYREYLAQEANRLYRNVSKENVSLEWQQDYEIVLADSLQGQKRERKFKQLSGGEQMTAALAVRLALLGQLSGVKVGFFDEPTTNLDTERRHNLAQILPNITGEFDQLFVISHDDSFDAMTDNIIKLAKDDGAGTKLA